MTRKLDFALDATGLQPGDRVLDIGGGWGAFTEYAGLKGIRVTSLTLSQRSKEYLDALIDSRHLPAEARLEHFYEHRPDEPYDAIVNLGVTEHLPDYPRTLRHYRQLLKPGARVYLDASAARRRNAPSTFLERHIYRGNGTFLVLHEYLEALARTPFRLAGVWDDRHSYALTTRHWARRLEEAREEVEERWGRTLFRKFQIYLWGCVDQFSRDGLQAYRLVLQLPE
jgi:cyclopropane-fatty-acyl-phospholipid synthase